MTWMLERWAATTRTTIQNTLIRIHRNQARRSQQVKKRKSERIRRQFLHSAATWILLRFRGNRCLDDLIYPTISAPDHLESAFLTEEFNVTVSWITIILDGASG